MRITTEEVRETVKIIDDLVKEYKTKTPEGERDWRTYEEQLAQRIRIAIHNFEPLIEEVIAAIQTAKIEKRGRKAELTLKQKTILLLVKHLLGRSNRDMSFMLMLFGALSGVDVSYKTVERLYSDEKVLMVLHNMHALLLKKKGVENPACSGDGTGYSLTVKKHYATEAKKLKNNAKRFSKKRAEMRFVYSFKLMDLDSRMYIGHGTSLRSEKDAFLKAVEMAGSIRPDSIRLDRYYSGQGCVKLMEEKFGDISIYLIPKKNATIGGSWKWKRMLHEFVNDTHGYLHEYFRRNQSESGFSEDKRRFGWRIAQRRLDRIDTADFCTLLWHNLFWLG